MTLLIPVFVLYDSKFWCSTYLIALFAISAWNGASFYSEFPTERSHRVPVFAIERLTFSLNLFLAPAL